MNQPTCLAASAHVRWDDVAESAKTEALKFQRALIRVLELWDNPLMPRAELERLGVESYAREFGRPISERHLRRLLQRIITRDAGRKDWTRPELFLCDNPPLMPVHYAEMDADPFAELQQIVSMFAKPGAPSPKEEALLWLQAWRLYQSRAGAGVSARTAKAELLRFLGRRAPWLTKGRRNALRMMVARQFKKHDEAAKQGRIAAEVALDRRVAKRGQIIAPEIPEEDIKKLGGYTLFATGKRLAQAKRELVALGEQSGLTAATLDLLDAGKSKSYVNRRVAKAIHPKIRIAAPFVLGRQAIDDATPALRCKHNERSLDIVTADDFTLPVPFPIPDGKGWFRMIVGQCLLWADVRSRKIITRVLVPTASYDSLDVASGMNTVCMEEGMPREWRYERGLWAKSNLVKRKPPKHWRLAQDSPAEVEYGWENLGVRFVHCKRARAKPAENIGGLLQNFMERCPGYRGRASRYDCPEETRKMLLAVEGKRMHPQKYFWSYDQWLSELDNLIELYNADRQDGDILDGRSPNEAYKEFWPANEVSKMDARCWHLVAHYVREFDVAENAIRFDYGSRFSYFDEELGKFNGQRVLGWFDPTHPGILGVTTLDKKNPVFVQRSNDPDSRAAYSTDPEVVDNYKREMAKQAGYMKHAKDTFRAFKGEFNRSYRPNIVDRQTAALATEMLAKRNEALTKFSEVDRRKNRILKKARQLNMSGSEFRDYSEDTEALLDRRLNARRREASESEMPQ